jgi:hypothetical protein
MDPADLVDGFFEHHSTADPTERARILDIVVADTAEFYGLQVHLVGREQIEAGPVGTSHLVRTSRVQQRGRWLRWEWEYRKPDGAPERAPDGSTYGGTGIGMLADDGRLQLIVPFLGSRP